MNKGSFDISKIVKKEQLTAAAGNAKMNARGDIIDSNDNIVVPKIERAKSRETPNNPNRIVPDE